MAIEHAEITDRTLKPAELKANVAWWFANDSEQRVTDADAQWYHPEWLQWRRELYWNYFRNPLQNFRMYVIGVADRNYTVVGRSPVMTIQRDDLDPPQRGWQWSMIQLGAIWLPFISYAGKRLVFQFGWQPNGFATAKLNIRKEVFNV